MKNLKLKLKKQAIRLLATSVEAEAKPAPSRMYSCGICKLPTRG